MADQETVKEMIKQGAKIIDVRTTGEFAQASYPGALNIPLDQFAAEIDDLGDKDAPYVLYCASGGRSEQAKMMMQAEGYTNVVNAGGLADMPPA